MFNISQYFLDEKVEQGDGERIALVCSDEKITYAELLSRVEDFSHCLTEKGIRREERVALLLFDRIEFVVAFFGIVRIGAIALLMNPTTRPTDAAKTLLEANTRLVLAENIPGDYSTLKDEVHAVDSQVQFYTVEDMKKMKPSHSTSGSALCTRTKQDSPCYWLCTGGTTDLPKIAMHRHLTMKIISELWRDTLNISKFDVFFSSAPIFHAYGFGNSISLGLGAGATVILEPRKPITPMLVSEVVEKHRPNYFFAVPTLYNLLLKANLPEDTFSSVKTAITAGEAIPHAVQQQFKNYFGVEIQDGIGSTEAGYIYLYNGKPVKGWEIELRSEQGNLLEFKEGQFGQLYVKGESNASGYYSRYKQSRSAFIGPFYRTGDQYIVDSDLRLSYVGRSEDLFKIHGEWVSPMEIENIILKHPSVKEACVIPRNDNEGFLEVIVFIVPNGNSTITEDDIINHCKLQNLESYKIPQRLGIVDAIPKTPVGKIRRNVVQAFPLSATKSQESLSVIISKVLGRNITEEDHQKTLSDLGVDSIGMARIVNKTEISFEKIYRQNIGSLINGSQLGDVFIDWQSECTLPKEILEGFKKQQDKQVEVPTIFLTGATGFLGLFILREILSQSIEFPIYVLIRGSSPQQRFRQAAQKYGIEFPENRLKNVHFVPGNLEEKYFGMDEMEFQKIASSVDIVIHNGAHVNWVLPYSILRKSNVVGTTECLRLCSIGNTKKKFYFISSIGAFLDEEIRQKKTIPENYLQTSKKFEISSKISNDLNGYGMTKRVSEYNCVNAFEHGLDGAIIRLGSVSGSNNTGDNNDGNSSNTSDFLNKFFKTICELQCAPKISNYQVSIAPVDWVAKIISSLVIQRKNFEGKIFTLVGLKNLLLPEIVQACKEWSGNSIEEVPLEKFSELVRSSECSLSPLAKFVNSTSIPIGDESSIFEHQNLLNLIKENPILEFPSIDYNVIKRYLTFLNKKQQC